MAGARTAALGRILATFGWIWILVAIVTALVLPGWGRFDFLPGIVIYLTGRALTALGRRGSTDEQAGDAEMTAPVEQPPLGERAREQRPVSQRNEYLDERRAPEASAPEAEATFEIPDFEEAILEAPPPMTSEEMVAEARRRYAPRPPEDND